MGFFAPCQFYCFPKTSFWERSKAPKFRDLRKKVVHLCRSTRLKYATETCPRVSGASGQRLLISVRINKGKTSVVQMHCRVNGLLATTEPEKTGPLETGSSATRNHCDMCRGCHEWFTGRHELGPAEYPNVFPSRMPMATFTRMLLPYLVSY